MSWYVIFEGSVSKWCLDTLLAKNLIFIHHANIHHRIYYLDAMTLLKIKFVEYSIDFKTIWMRGVIWILIIFVLKTWTYQTIGMFQARHFLVLNPLMLTAAKSSLTILMKPYGQKWRWKNFIQEMYSEHYQQLSFKYFVKSLIPNVSSKVP